MFILKVFAHVYHTHLQSIEEIGQVEFLNTTFKHFIYFVETFQLVDQQVKTIVKVQFE